MRAAEIKKGNVVEHDGKVYQIRDIERSSPQGRGGNVKFRFIMVAIGVLILRKKDPNRHRPFRTPLVWIVCPLAAIGCIVLFWSLSPFAKYFFLCWGLLGLVVYALYGYRRSQLAPPQKGG